MKVVLNDSWAERRRAKKSYFQKEVSCHLRTHAVAERDVGSTSTELLSSEFEVSPGNSELNNIYKN